MSEGTPWRSKKQAVARKKSGKARKARKRQERTQAHVKPAFNLHRQTSEEIIAGGADGINREKLEQYRKDSFYGK